MTEVATRSDKFGKQNAHGTCLVFWYVCASGRACADLLNRRRSHVRMEPSEIFTAFNQQNKCQFGQSQILSVGVSSLNYTNVDPKQLKKTKRTIFDEIKGGHHCHPSWESNVNNEV